MVVDGKQRVRHCFSINKVACDSSKKCCGMGVKKIELFAE